MSTKLQETDAFGSFLTPGKRAIDLAMRGNIDDARKLLESQIVAMVSNKRTDIVASLTSKDARAIQTILHALGTDCCTKVSSDLGINARVNILNAMKLPIDKHGQIVQLLQEPKEFSKLAKKLTNLDKIQPLIRPVASANVKLRTESSPLPGPPVKVPPVPSWDAMRARETCTFELDWMKDGENAERNCNSSCLPKQVDIEVAGFTREVRIKFRCKSKYHILTCFFS